MSTTEPTAGRVHRALVARAKGRFGPLDHVAIVDLVLRASPLGGFSVHAAALDAVEGRYRAISGTKSATVYARPAATAGAWHVGIGARREHEVLIRSRSPISVSCSCSYYWTSSLGICEHALAALLVADPRTHSGQDGAVTRDVTWDERTPLRGPIDPVARVQVRGSHLPLPSGRAAQPPTEVLASLEAHYAVLREVWTDIADRMASAEPAALQTLARAIQRVWQHQHIARAEPAAVDALESLLRPLYDYQREAVVMALRGGALLLADEMGLGKTTVAAAIGHALLRSGGAARVLVVVPPALCSEWQREWAATTDEPLTVVRGTPKQRQRLYAATARGALVIGYELLQRDLERVRTWAPDVMIIDEAQRSKNRDTLTSSTVRSLRARYRIAMTGTPLENRLPELLAVVEFIAPHVLGPTWRLAPFYTVTDERGRVVRHRNLDVLHQRAASFYLRRRLKDVAADLPKRVDHTIEVGMLSAQRSAHDDLGAAISRLVAMTSGRARTRKETNRLHALRTRQRRTANGLGVVDFEKVWGDLQAQTPTDQLVGWASPKLLVLRRLLPQLVGEGRKVAIFSEWTTTLKLADWAMRETLARLGLRAAFFTGDQTAKEREAARKDFLEDPTLAVLLLSDAGAWGMNLQHAAATCVLLEPAWNPAKADQRVARVHRPGQTREVHVYHLVTRGSIEIRIVEAASTKHSVAAAVLDGAATEVAVGDSA